MNEITVKLSQQKLYVTDTSLEQKLFLGPNLHCTLGVTSL